MLSSPGVPASDEIDQGIMIVFPVLALPVKNISMSLPH